MSGVIFCVVFNIIITVHLTVSHTLINQKWNGIILNLIMIDSLMIVEFIILFSINEFVINNEDIIMDEDIACTIKYFIEFSFILLSINVIIIKTFISFINHIISQLLIEVDKIIISILVEIIVILYIRKKITLCLNYGFKSLI